MQKGKFSKGKCFQDLEHDVQNRSWRRYLQTNTKQCEDTEIQVKSEKHTEINTDITKVMKLNIGSKNVTNYEEEGERQNCTNRKLPDAATTWRAWYLAGKLVSLGHTTNSWLQWQHQLTGSFLDWSGEMEENHRRDEEEEPRAET